MSNETDDFRGWRKSSRSNGGQGTCVEVGADPTLIAVRDTKDREGGQLVFERSSWAAFVQAL